MRHLDLFAGIGGFSRAVEWLGGETVGFVEWESWNRRVLAKHWPGARFFSDIKDVTNDDLRQLGRIDLVTGGYPCQPFSLAGQRRGAEDDRHLWPEMRRVIEATRPRFVLAENVAGHITMGLDTVLSDLEADGYTCGAVVVPAGAVNALHRRDRVWVMGYSDEDDDRPGRGEHQRERQGVYVERCGLRHEPGRTGDLQGMADATARGLRRGSAPGQAGQPAQRGQGVADTRQGDGGWGASPAGGHITNGQDAERPEGPGRTDQRRESVPDTYGRRRHPSEHNRGGTASIGTSSDVAAHGTTRQETPRSLDPRVDGLRAGLVRRPATRPADIRAAWADGSWETGLPRVVTDEPERRLKLMAAGNAIVSVVAYEILRVMIGEDE